VDYLVLNQGEKNLCLFDVNLNLQEFCMCIFNCGLNAFVSPTSMIVHLHSRIISKTVKNLKSVSFSILIDLVWIWVHVD